MPHSKMLLPTLLLKTTRSSALWPSCFAWGFPVYPRITTGS
ncbi:hypothetical protein E2C01_072640 [Portunus trituberculatus]|uniref:Uncharacterized protein n=1 Tax=Portunus trituberculatus TaxID=210409 RepID=A0A5B7IB95_PORTR|nr:hypothetical protein [Portunus trituberculatus]